MTTPAIGHNGPDEPEIIADYLDRQAERFAARAGKTGNGDLSVRASAYRVAASDVRARLYIRG